MGSVACLLLIFGADLEPTKQPVAARGEIPSPVAGSRWQAESENFVVANRHPAQDARKVAEYCEQCRSQLQQYWCEGPCQPWTLRCKVFVHPNQSAYGSAVGAGAAQTFGSSLIAFGKDKQVSKRQIDFRGDSSNGIEAVPHEMTHVVLADLLGGSQPPRWADEGMAVLADNVAKQRLHHRDLSTGLSRRMAFRTPELLTLDHYPHPSRVPSFYGQSASLTAFLVARDRPATFVAFVRDAQGRGYDAALREHYQIANITELERLWQRHLAAPPADAVAAVGALVRSKVVE